MANEEKTEETQQINGDNPIIGFAKKVQAKYRDLKEDAVEYPYVWGSYAVVYGGFGLWFCYRWRKLRKTEDRVRALQERLRQLTQAEESASASSTSEKASPPADISKPPK